MDAIKMFAEAAEFLPKLTAAMKLAAEIASTEEISARL
jgi:hypothetical protein